jgi:L-rhamnose mutarotase
MPREVTETRTVYTLQELQGAAREKALQKLADWNTDYGWWDTSIAQCKELGAHMGIEITDIFFSGFSSQGDGACYTGAYSYRKGAVAKIKAEYPQETELHRIVTELQKIQRRNFYRLAAIITKPHRGVHEHSVYITVETHSVYAGVTADDETDLADVLRDFMRWIYRSLEKEYEYLTSEEELIEMADANGYEFTATGEIA